MINHHRQYRPEELPGFPVFQLSIDIIAQVTKNLGKNFVVGVTLVFKYQGHVQLCSMLTILATIYNIGDMLLQGFVDVGILLLHQGFGVKQVAKRCRKALPDVFRHHPGPRKCLPEEFVMRLMKQRHAAIYANKIRKCKNKLHI